MMKSNFAIAFFLCLVIDLSSNAQSYTKYWDKTFGGNSWDFYPKIHVNNNGEIFIIGHSITNISGDKTQPLCTNSIEDIWLLKIDSSGSIIYDKDLGGNEQDEYVNFIITRSGKILFVCFSYSDSSCDKSTNQPPYLSLWLCMLDSDGTKLWDKTFTSRGSAIISPDIVELSTGDFVVCTQVDSAALGLDQTVSNSGGFDFWAVKLDSLGNKIWDNVYGGNLDENHVTIAASDKGSFVLAGTTYSGISGSISEPSRGGIDAWIIKVDSSGHKVWDKRYGGINGDLFFHVCSIIDNGFILAGTTGSPQGGDISQAPIGVGDSWIVKLDSLGNKVWDRRYGGGGGSPNRTGADWIEPYHDGGYWFAGEVLSDSGNDVSEPSYGQQDYWIVKIDSQGNKIWDKRFGAAGDDIVGSFAYLPDSSIIICGMAYTDSSASKTDYGKGFQDYWAVRFKYSNNIPVNVNELQDNNSGLTFYPNPSEGIINYSSLKNAKQILIYNTLGEFVFHKNISGENPGKIDCSSLPDGAYLLRVETVVSFQSKIFFIQHRSH